MAIITLTKGYTTQVDDSEYAGLMVGNKWYAHERKRPDGSIKNVYAERTVYTNGKRTAQKMHRFLLGVTDPKVEVDHEDHNGLNNQRYNLRKASEAENQHNRRLNSNNTSGYKGVCWQKDWQKWKASIQVDGKRKHLGYFDSAEQAAQAYDLSALELHKEFAYTNQMMMAQEVAA